MAVAAAQELHVQIARPFDPLLVDLHHQRLYQPQAAGRLGKDTHCVEAPLDLLVQLLQHIGGLGVLRVLAR